MKIKLISILLFVLTIGAISLMNTGCASNVNPATTQNVISTGDSVYNLMNTGYTAAAIFADVEYSKKDISVNSWNNQIIPAFAAANTAAVTFINNYDAEALNGGSVSASLQAGANKSILAIYPIIEQAILSTVAGNGPGGQVPTIIPPLPAAPE